MQPDLSTLPGRGSMVIACAECQRPMRIFPSFLTYRPQPTCSQVCRDTRRQRLAREANSRPCVVCGVPFYRAPSSFEKEGRKTCGLKCRAVWQTGRKLAAPDSLNRRFSERRVRQDGCWGWTGTTTADGYGYIGGPDQKTFYAHRLAWEEATGDTLTSDDFIGHICDTPPCTRNDDEGTYQVLGVSYPRRGHLFKTTNAGNSLDMWQKGRHRPTGAVGTRNSNARLTEADIRAIRLAAASGESDQSIAERFPITVMMVGRIRRRQNWTHVE